MSGKFEMTVFSKAARVIAVTLALIALILSLAAITGIALHGQVVWKVAETRILQASHFGRPMAVGLLSLVILLRLLRPQWFNRVTSLFNIHTWFLLILLAVVAYKGLVGPHTLHGDGNEYILQTQAMVFDRSIKVNCAARREYWNRTNPYGTTLKEARKAASTLSESAQAGGGFGGLYPDRFGDYRYYHFWIYPAVVAPVYYLFHCLSPLSGLEYHSFRFANVCLLLVFFCLAFRRNPHWPALMTLVLLLFSPLIPYCDWHHPEIFCLTLTFAAFHLATNRLTVHVSPILLGLAASMNPPIALFFPCHCLVAGQNMNSWQWRSILSMAASYLAGILVALSSPAYYLYYFQTPNVIAHIGLASLKYASASRAMDIFFSPFIGAVFFFPALPLLLPACLTRRNWITASAILVSAFAAAWLASSTANLNAGQVGTTRYAVWLLAPLWFLLFCHIPGQFNLKSRGHTHRAGIVRFSYSIFENIQVNKQGHKTFHRGLPCTTGGGRNGPPAGV